MTKDQVLGYGGYARTAMAIKPTAKAPAAGLTCAAAPWKVATGDGATVVAATEVTAGAGLEAGAEGAGELHWAQVEAAGAGAGAGALHCPQVEAAGAGAGAAELH